MSLMLVASVHVEVLLAHHLTQIGRVLGLVSDDVELASNGSLLFLILRQNRIRLARFESPRPHEIVLIFLLDDHLTCLFTFGGLLYQVGEYGTIIAEARYGVRFEVPDNDSVTELQARARGWCQDSQHDVAILIEFIEER